jgi:hypothetical protein
MRKMTLKDLHQFALLISIFSYFLFNKIALIQPRRLFPNLRANYRKKDLDALAAERLPYYRKIIRHVNRAIPKNSHKFHVTQF